VHGAERAAVAGQHQHCVRLNGFGRDHDDGGDSRLSWRTLSRALANARLSAGNRVFGPFPQKKITDQTRTFGGRDRSL
jgi:hypothetical protein